MSGLFDDVAERSPCSCYSSAIYFRNGCACSAMERVCKAHLNGNAVEPLSEEQQACIISDTYSTDPGPWNGSQVQGPGRDEAICSDWWNAVCNYVSSL